MTQRYVAEQTWNGLNTTLGGDCAWYDAACLAQKAAAAIDKGAGDALDTVTGGKWSESQKARTQAAEALGLQEKKTSISKPGTPSTSSAQSSSNATAPITTSTGSQGGVPLAVVIGGLATVGIIGILLMRKKKK